MKKANSNQIKFIFTVPIICIIGLTSCGTDKLLNIKICETLNPQKICQYDLRAFQTKTQKLFVSANLERVSRNPLVKIEWKYFSGNQEVPLTSETVEVKEPKNFVTASLSSPPQGFPAGKYTVILTLPKEKDSQPYVKEFTMTP